MIERWLAEFDRHLRVHGRRRRRVIEELDASPARGRRGARRAGGGAPDGRREGGRGVVHPARGRPAVRAARPAGGAADAGGDGGQPAAGAHARAAGPAGSVARLGLVLRVPRADRGRGAGVVPGGAAAPAAGSAAGGAAARDGGGDGGGGAARPAAVAGRVPHVPGGRDRSDAPAVLRLRSRLRRHRPRLRDPHQLLAGCAGAVRLLPVGRHRLDAAPAASAPAREPIA